MKKILICIVSLVVLQSCVPALIVGVAYSGSKSREDRRIFMSNFNKTNTEREAKGLKPLNFCVEAGRFDKGWADSKEECNPKHTKIGG